MGIPFLWLCGPSGVGKSTVGWEIFRQLAGAATAYVDADQLGLCYPGSPDDRQNHRLKARNLGVVWAAFRSAGVQSMVLSGGVDSVEEVRLYADEMAGAELTLCRLRAKADTLTDRFVRRGWMTQLAPEAVAEAEELDRLDFAELRVDTDGLSVAEVAGLVRERAGGWPRPVEAQMPVSRPAPAGDPVPVLLLCGAPGVGKSTVGYAVFTQILAQTKAAYVDLAQIGFVRPARADDPENHRLRAAILAAMWPGFRDAGARRLIVTGRVNDAAAIRTYAEAMPAADWTVCRLHAGREALTERIEGRGRGEGPAIMGNELRGQPPEAIREAAERAVAEAERMHRAGIGDMWVDTDGRCVEDVVAQVLARL